MSDPIMQKLDEMQARCTAATFDGGWLDLYGPPSQLRAIYAVTECDMPRLVAALKAVVAGHRPVTYSFSWTEGVQMHEVCPTCYDKAGVHECGCWREEDEDDHQCAVCSMPEVNGGKVSWPCRTVTTIQTALGVADA